MAKLRVVSARAAAALSEFLRLESASGLMLVGAAALGLLAANSPLSRLYDLLLGLPVGVRVGALAVDKPLLLWINDGLMAIFFLLVAMELKREMLEGQLSDRSQIALPLACAVGGMVVPMALYAMVNRGDPVAMAGVAIPAATDIAFALGILGLVGSRAPLGLKLLLTAIAVFDDLGAIVLIAIFYTSQLSFASLAVALAAIAALALLNRRGVTSTTPYLLLGLVTWVAVLKSGVHATLAGVALGALVPLRDARDPAHSPLEQLEHDLHPTVAFVILPIFAFANAGVPLAGLSLAAIGEPVPLGITLGLLVGKPLGVALFGGALVALGLGRLPDGVGVGAFLGMGCLCGIGFTMSLFVSSLAFESGGIGADYLVASRIGILLGTALAALAGFLLLRRLPPGEPAQTTLRG